MGYDVFLSYSHLDRDNFGKEYILRIKNEIESSLKGLVIGHAPKVFLDAEALHLGELWHSKIVASLRQCKVFVCLVSDQYLNSDYCARERLWWDAQQTRDGRIFNRPYPVYFVKLKDKKRADAKDLMAVEMDRQPWFYSLDDVKRKVQEEFIRERLNNISKAVKEQFSARYVKSYCSVLPPLHVNFVGRITELRELHEHCANGKYPVIQAFGGVGKTELSVAYAYGFADRYPMGRFMFRMEGVKSWDEAFAAALKMQGIADDGTSRKVFEELNISSEDLEKRDRVELHELAADAFQKRAVKGQLLILLDNLDEETTLLTPSNMRDFLCDKIIPGNIHILATTRGSFRFSEQESFLSYELENLKEDEAFEMLCLAGNGLYPFDKQPPDAGNEEYQAAREVLRLLDNHAWSMEIISAFMADNYLDGQYSFAMELAALREKNIMFISSEVGSYREKTATSVQLLQPTLDKLATLELGEEIVELAVFAACFEPDDIPMYLLREYWKINFPAAVCSCGVPFTYAVNRLTKYHLLRRFGDICKMHRLVQSVFLMRKETYLDKIAKTISKFLFVPSKYWGSLLLQNPELIELCPQDGTLDCGVWEKLLDNPVFEAKCPWQSFSGKDWARLLAEHPEYASHHPSWESLDSWGWMWLLSRQPKFADKCQWDKLNGIDWGRLLKERPQFADKCDWNSLNGFAWAMLLENQPDFADRCDWSKLDGDAWRWLLEAQPQFADKCDWNKLDGNNWKELLKKHPELSVNVRFDYLNADSYASLLGEFPQFIKNCNLSHFSGNNWVMLLEKQPQFADCCDWSKLDGDDWRGLLETQPQFADKCDWSKLDGHDWMKLLIKRPEFAKHCDWSKLNGQDWIKLLIERPEFANYCDWNKLGANPRMPRLDIYDSDLGDLLIAHPEFADRCGWNKLNGRDWAKLLVERPDFAVRCDWNKLNGRDWAILLSEQPQFVEHCDWNRFDGDDWTRMLECLPKFAEKCDWSKLSGWNWAWLLKRQPQLADYCDWNALKSGDWAELLGERPEFAVHCDWSKLEGHDWKALIEKHPQFAEKCDWDKLDGLCWCWLLARYPVFADKCNWSKLSGWDFSGLLSVQPQFADRCDWSELNGWGWKRLLEEQPQFAIYCNWSKLSGDDWDGLLKKQPQLAKHCDLSKLSEKDRLRLLERYPQLRRQD